MFRGNDFEHYYDWKERKFIHGKTRISLPIFGEIKGELDRSRSVAENGTYKLEKVPFDEAVEIVKREKLEEARRNKIRCRVDEIMGRI